MVHFAVEFAFIPEFTKVSETLQDIRSSDLPGFTRPTTALPDRIYCDTQLIVKTLAAA